MGAAQSEGPADTQNGASCSAWNARSYLTKWQGAHRGGGKRDSLQEKNILLGLSESVRVAGRFCPAAPTVCTNLSYVTALCFDNDAT